MSLRYHTFQSLPINYPLTPVCSLHLRVEGPWPVIAAAMLAARGARTPVAMRAGSGPLLLGPGWVFLSKEFPSRGLPEVQISFKHLYCVREMEQEGVKTPSPEAILCHHLWSLTTNYSIKLWNALKLLLHRSGIYTETKQSIQSCQSSLGRFQNSF